MRNELEVREYVDRAEKAVFEVSDDKKRRGQRKQERSARIPAE